MTNEEIWENDTPITELGFTVEPWIEQGITPYTVAAIYQGGCASGAYMPAVTYYDALQTMNKHGDDVLQFIEDRLGYVPDFGANSWSAMAVYYLSTAVELWAERIHDGLEEMEAA
jgi:hypothetical protein